MVETLLILAGMCFGVAIVTFIRRTMEVGTLRVDQSDPNESDPYLFLELDKPIGKFRHKKYIVLKVKDRNYISRD